MTHCNTSRGHRATIAIDGLHDSPGGGDDSVPAWTRQAVAITAIPPNQKGRVHFQGSDWPAQNTLTRNIAPGETVYIRYRRNLTLYVGAKPY